MSSTKLYILSCGHSKQLEPDKFNKGLFECKVCKEERLASKALSKGFEILPGKYPLLRYRVRDYKCLNCGLVQQKFTVAMEKKSPRCLNGCHKHRS